MNIEINDQFKSAINQLESGINIFITGKAGTGKSTLLTYFKENTTKNIVILAPTGVAAVSIKGETIHSFFGFKPGITPEEAKKLGYKCSKDSIDLYKSVDVIIIDEISMVRCDLIDSIDIFLREALRSKLSFAGKQVIFFGDLYQLSPVAKAEELKAILSIYETPYFFSSEVIKNLINNNELKLIELEKVYRQSDQNFINFLNKIRIGEKDEKTLEIIQSQVLNNNHIIDDQYIYLTARNDQADILNEKRLNELKIESHRYEANVRGDFNNSSFPAPQIVDLKLGARVMFLNNDSSGRWINGTLGVVKSITKTELLVKIDDKTDLVNVKANTWELSRTVYNQEKKHLEREEVGSFTQIPLRLAWAITIHKSQGKTFDKVVIDLGASAFALGQTYVALSRCRTLEGIILLRNLRSSDIRMDIKVSKFLNELQHNISNNNQSNREKTELITNAIKNRERLAITYLKGTTDKSERTIRPVKIGEMIFQNIKFLGVEAYCEKDKAIRVFNVGRIINIDKIL